MPPGGPPPLRPGRSTNQLAFLRSKVLKSLLKHKHVWPFRTPVDAKALNIPDYYRIVKHPMDLGTINERLDNNYYWSGQECIRDIDQVFANCYLYNKPDQDVVVMAKMVEQLYRTKVAGMPEVEVEVGPSRKVEPVPAQRAALVRPSQGLAPALVRPSQEKGPALVRPSQGKALALVQPSQGKAPAQVRPSQGLAPALVRPSQGKGKPRTPARPVATPGSVARRTPDISTTNIKSNASTTKVVTAKADISTTKALSFPAAASARPAGRPRRGRRAEAMAACRAIVAELQGPQHAASAQAFSSGQAPGQLGLKQVVDRLESKRRCEIRQRLLSIFLKILFRPLYFRPAT
jgi:hypothetical protein